VLGRVRQLMHEGEQNGQCGDEVKKATEHAPSLTGLRRAAVNGGGEPSHPSVAAA
jgi:hypothetical protein